MMKKLSKPVCSLLLTAVVLMATVLSGCTENTNYTDEIKEYQSRLESLAAENEELKAQLGITETVSETDSGSAAETESETVTQTQSATETVTAERESAGQTENPEDSQEEEDLRRILVLGDSIWGNYRDDTGVAAKVKYYMEKEGYRTELYNAAIGGTRATLDPEDNPYEFGPASDNSLAKMVSVLNGKTDVELLQGKAAYEDMKAALEVKDDIDVVIIAYGMNDFLSQVPINSSDDPWTGFGTALTNGVLGVRSACPQAKVLIAAPSYASYFSIPVQNMGEKALYNYASVACDVARGQKTFCVDAYNNLGINAYNSDDYVEDGVHLNEKGRDLYARGIVACLLYGRPGQISGNAIEYDD